MAWIDQLRPASFRGVRFAVLGADKQVGRRLAVHEYPFRDSPWAEDLGKSTRRHRVQGFLLQDARYGGGDVLAQRQNMEKAAETKGVATLVHPTLGSIRVTLSDLTVSEKWDEGRYFELQFTLVESGDLSFTQVLAAMGGLLGDAAALLRLAGATDFVADIIVPLQGGLAVVENVADTAQAWVSQVQDLGVDATNLFGSLALLGGDTGRYASGRVDGYVQAVAPSPTTVAALIANAATSRASIGAAAENLSEVILGIGASTAAADIPPAVQAHVAALSAACPDPASGVRLLAALAAFVPTVQAASSVAGMAISTLYRRAAVGQLALAGSNYAPSSFDDSVATRATITGAVDAELQVAGDTGADDVFNALRALRQNVVLDLQQRGGSLAPLTPLVSAVPLPDVVLAMRRYGYPNRADELVTQADPPNPLFMPTSFLALAT